MFLKEKSHYFEKMLLCSGIILGGLFMSFTADSSHELRASIIPTKTIASSSETNGSVFEIYTHKIQQIHIATKTLTTELHRLHEAKNATKKSLEIKQQLLEATV